MSEIEDGTLEQGDGENDPYFQEQPVEPPKPPKAQIIDLMAALKASLAEHAAKEKT